MWVSHGRALIGLILAAVFVHPPTVLADTLKMKSGAQLRGTFVETERGSGKKASDQRVVFELTSGAVMRLPLNSIEWVRDEEDRLIDLTKAAERTAAPTPPQSKDAGEPATAPPPPPQSEPPVLEAGKEAFAREDFATARNLLTPLARDGDAQAQYILGETFYFEAIPKSGPSGPPPSLTRQAAKWYRMAADQGLADAQMALGALYEHGHGVPMSTSDAMRWYRKAAAQGHAEAREAVAEIESYGGKY